MNPQTRLWLICYDVADDDRRTKIYRTLRGFGDHLQFSVFRCPLSDLQLALLRDRLTPFVAPTADQILFVPLGRPDSPRLAATFTMGIPLPATDRTVKIL